MHVARHCPSRPFTHDYFSHVAFAANLGFSRFDNVFAGFLQSAWQAPFGFYGPHAKDGRVYVEVADDYKQRMRLPLTAPQGFWQDKPKREFSIRSRRHQQDSGYWQR